MQKTPARARYAILLAQFLNGMGYGLVFPVAAYTIESLGASEGRAALITAVIAVHPLARLLSGPLWGSLADRLGRVPVLLAGLLLSALGHLIFGFAGSIPTLVLARALTGLGTGDMVASAAIVADTTSGAARAEGIGQLRASYGLGMLLGPLLGGLCGLWDLSLPAKIAAGLCALNLVFAWYAVPETGSGRARERLQLGLLRGAGVLPSLWIALSTTLALAMAEAIVALAIEHVLVPNLGAPSSALRGTLSDREVALLLTVALIMGWGLTMAFVEGWAAGKLAPRWGEGRLVRWGLALWTLAFLFSPQAYLSGLFVGAVVVVGTAAAAGLVSTCTSSLYSRSLSEDEQGSGFGLYQSAAAVGEVLGPATAGLLFDQWFGWPYFAGAVLLATALAASAGLQAPQGARGTAG